MAKKKAKNASKESRRAPKKRVISKVKQKPRVKKKGPSMQAALPTLENVHRAKIKVIGIGGGGGNIVSEIASRTQRFDFISANTDNQALKDLSRKVRGFAFGQELTEGLGCGMNADLGEEAAKAEKDRIRKLLEGSDVCILISSLGGGTGSGATATFAEVAQELKILCIGIFTLPFPFEGDRRKQIAEKALENIRPLVNTYVIIPNDHIFNVIDEKTPLKESLSALNKRLAATLQGFMDTLAMPGLINIDFADVRSILEGKGRLAFINSAEAAGASKAQDVVQTVLQNPLLAYTIAGADRVLFNVTGDRNMKMQDVAYVSSTIANHNPRARVIFGMSVSSRSKERLKVTLFAIGCNDSGKFKKLLRRKKKIDPVVEVNVGVPEEKKEDKVVGKTQPAKPAKPVKKKASPKKKVVAKKSKKPTEKKGKVRRSALEVKKAVDKELQEIEQKEREWDIPAFLRQK